MKRIVIIVLCISAGIVMKSCSEYSEDIGDFGIYLLADSTLAYSDIASTPIRSLKLQSEPVITTADIINYRIVYSADSTCSLFHRMVLADTAVDKLGSEIIPYVVNVGANRIYVGEYWPQMMSIMDRTVTMIDMSDHYWITAREEQMKELNDSRIIQALENGGVEIIYDTVGDSTSN